jgi:hypothetical protein
MIIPTTHIDGDRIKIAMKSLASVNPISIKDKIYTIRNMQVMLDEDLAFLYGVQTKRLNEQVKRNNDRFPPEFCFQLSRHEYANLMSQIATSNSINISSNLLRSQIATSNKKGGRQYPPYVFTEQGVAMLSAVLRNGSSSPN